MIKRALSIIVTLALVIFGGLMISKSLKANATKEQTQYRIAPLATGLVKKTVTATGTLTPWKTVDIKSRAGGRVISLPVEEGMRVKKGQRIAEIDPSDTLLTYNSAKADIASNRARVDETDKTLTLQKSQTEIDIRTAKANLVAARATANASKARYQSAQAQADAQAELSDSAIENAKATLEAEKARLVQMTNASNPQAQAQSVAALNQANANLVNAKAQMQRKQKLVDKGYAAQSDMDVAQAAYDVAVANAASAQEKVDTIKPQLDNDVAAEQARVNQEQAMLRTAQANRVDVELKRQAALAARADYEQAVANVKQVDAKLSQAMANRLNNGIRETQILQAQASGERSKASLVNAQIQLDDTKVDAPSDGIILKKYIEQGTLITSGISFNSSGTSIVQMGDISRMYVDVQVDETDVANVDEGQAVDINFDAYPTTPFEGKVIKIEPQAVIDQNVTTVHVRVEVNNDDAKYRLLKPGMNATCEFVINKKDGVLALPNEALKTDSDGNRYVEVAEGGIVAPADKDNAPDPTLFVAITTRKITLTSDQIGIEGNDTTEIKDGLKAGDRIITQTIEPTPAASGGSGNPFGGSKGPGRR